jgi:hypothetical protein
MIITTNNNEVLIMYRILSALLLTCLTTLPAFAEVVRIPADRDATLIEFTEITQPKKCPINVGDVCANGSGPSFFAGHTNQSEFGTRRGLVHFDVAGALPENALIDGASLRLYQSSGNPEPSDVSLHRVLSDWGEGETTATGGQGVPAADDDATWLHTFYDYDYWVQQGGHFVPHANAIVTVAGKDFYNWQNSVNMVNNVRLWLHAPQQNYGWLVMGDEDTRGSVKSFYSRECLDAPVDVKHRCENSDQRPMLMIEYHLPGE